MYNHNKIEKKWQKYWKKHKTNKFVDDGKPKFYVLDMFPYPSGSGLHVGHPKGYTGTDIIARYKILKGYNVLHPIGWDAFGLPAEQYALQTGNHPREFTEQNINRFREQLESLGFNYDYEKEVNTTDPEYFKWTQWIFTKLFEEGLAEIKDVEVNWCEKLGTVLANEEVLTIKGKKVSERGEHPVTKKPMRQWVLKITKYADKLLDGLETIDWPESLKTAQQKWIGRSKGATINFLTKNKTNLEIYTTRPDTVFGCTFIGISPENRLIKEILTKDKFKEYEKFIKTKKIDFKENSEKLYEGFFTGSYAVNPLNENKIPIYVANYVVQDYGTGIVMGVPAHCKSDFEFAKKHKLPVKWVIKTKNKEEAFEKNGIHINSDFLNGMSNEEAIEKILIVLKDREIGNAKTNYKLRDWLFSRQRYWGEPFPILFDGSGKPILDKNVPIILPEVKDIKPSGTGESPLANVKDWINVEINGQFYKRDSNTMPQWAGSCWYYLGYLLKNKDKYIDLNSPEAFSIFQRWLPVDIYVGGQEHAVLHLLYARFWHRFLYDIKIVPTPEPFMKIINQGMILGENGEKMSKSKGNVINPDDIIKTHGADALRLYEMFMGPLTASLPWTEEGLNGMRKWLDRVDRVINKSKIGKNNSEKLKVAYNKFINDIGQELEAQNFNVAISCMMVFINECYKEELIPKEYFDGFTIIFSCFAPHLAEELWERLGHMGSVTKQEWPKYNKNLISNSTLIMPIQINGKLRHTIEVPKNLNEDGILQIINSNEKIKNLVGKHTVKKTIIVLNKIVNIII